MVVIRPARARLSEASPSRDSVLRAGALKRVIFTSGNAHLGFSAVIPDVFCGEGGNRQTTGDTEHSEGIRKLQGPRLQEAALKT